MSSLWIQNHMLVVLQQSQGHTPLHLIPTQGSSAHLAIPKAAVFQKTYKSCHLLLHPANHLRNVWYMSGHTLGTEFTLVSKTQGPGCRQ